MSCGDTEPPISLEDRGRILAYREMGTSYNEIAKIIGCSVGAVHHIVQKQQQTGADPSVVENRSLHKVKTD